MFLKKIILPLVIFFALVLGLTASSSSVKGNSSNESFSRAKRILLNQVYPEHRTTFYCGCTFNSQKKVSWNSCGYKAAGKSKRAKRIEWEHVVPAHAFGKSFREWRQGHPACITRKGKRFKGRKCAEKANAEYRLMQSDMYNLYPAIGEVNKKRSNYSMSIIPGEKRIFGACDIEIENKKVEPCPKIRGDIARTYMYMNSAYPGKGIISKKNRKLFKSWDRTDPVDRWECKRARKIEGIQGNTNAIVIKRCNAKGL